MSEQVIVSFDFPGVQEGERAVKMLSALQSTLQAGKGSGKALEEMRKAMLGLRGQASVFEDLRNAVVGLNSAADSIKNSFGKSLKDLSRIMKQEFAELRAVVNNASAEIGKSAGAGMAKAMEQASTQGTKSLKSKMKRDLQEMQAALESELAKGVKFSAKDFGDFKAWGLNIGMDAKQGIREGLISERGRGSAIDVKTILGLSDQLVRKSAKDSASVFTAAFAAEAGRGKDTFREFSSMMGLDNSKVAKSARDSATVFNAAYAAEQKKFNTGVQSQVKAATIQATGPYSNINTGQLMNMPKADEVDKLSGAFKRLTIDGNDAHSMARGLASGFNALWLTWGNLLPLFTGAGISFGLKKTFDIGSEVEYNVKFMEVLGQTTKEQGSIIRQELRAIDQTTMFSLTELSKSMITLGQAGLSPKEALQTLKPAADLAAAGMVDLDTATKLLIQTNALFGLSAKDTAKTAAQIFVATKSGVLNVEDIGGSMKYASEANTRFGKSLSETLAILGTLAQAGIKGAAGGTAYINFLRDLNGRSGPAIAALGQLNAVLEKTGNKKIEVFNDDGTQKDAITLMEGIAKAAGLLKSSDADKILAKFFSDRGGRPFFAMIREGTVNLRDMVKELDAVDDKGTVLLDAAKGMMDTTKGAVNILQGALVGALDEVFELNADKFKTFIKDITAVVSSNEFKNGVYGMVAAVGSLYETLKMILPVLTTLGAAWAVFKAASIGVAIFQGIAAAVAAAVTVVPAFISGTVAATKGITSFTTAIVANGTALVGQAAAARVSTIGMTEAAAASARAAAVTTATAATAGVGMRVLTGAIGFLANPIVGVIATLGMLGYAFWDANKSANAAMSSTTDGVLANGKVNMAQWDKEIQKLRDRNKLLGDSYSGADDTITKAREAQVERENRLKTMKSDYSKQFDGKIQGRPLVQAAAQDAVNKIDDLQREVIIESQLINKMQADVSLARVKADRERFDQEQKAKNKQNLLPPKGEGVDVPKGPGRGGFGGPTTDFQAFKIAQDNTLAEIQKGATARLATYKTMYDQEKQLMDAEHSAKLMSEGTYQARVFASTEAFEARTLAELRQANSDIYDAYGERYEQIDAMLNKAKAANKGGALDSVVEKLTQDLENLENTTDNMIDGNLEKMFQTQTVAANRFQLAAVAARGELVALQKSSTDYWAKNGEEQAKIKALDAINDQYEILNESVFSLDRAMKAGAIAAVNEFEKHREHIRGMEQELRRAELAYIDYGIAAMEAGPPTEAQVAELGRMKEKVKLLQDIRENSVANANRSTEEASEAARNRQLKDQVSQFNKGLADAFETAIFEGGKAGAKKMRDFLQEELLRKPLRVVLQSVLNTVTGGITGTGSGTGGLGQLFQGLGSVLGGSSLPSAANPNSPDFVGPPAPEGAGNGAASALGGLSNLASVGQSIYSLYNGTGPIATAWKGISTWASSLSTTAAAATTATTAATAAGVVATPVYTATAVGTALPAFGTAAAAAPAAGAAGAGFMGMATTNWVMLIMAIIANAFGIFRSKKLIGSGLQGTLGSDKDLTSWEETRIGGTLFSGPEFETVDPMAQYEALRQNDLKNIAALKAGGGSATNVVMQPYDKANMGNTQMGDMNFREDMEERAWNLKGQSDALQSGYRDFRDGIVKMANGLGLAGDSLQNFQFTLDQQDLNFKDLDDEEIQEKITAAYGKAGAEMLKGVMGTWITETVDVVNQTQLTQLTMASDATYDLQLETVTRTRYVASEFAKGGETAFDTLTRLSNSFHAVNNASDALGLGVFQASLGVAAAADKIVDAFGGLEEFMNTTSAFINNFFTSSQKKDATARQLSRDLGNLGINISAESLAGSTTEQMIASVNSLVSNPKLMSDVMKLVNGAAVLWQVTEDAAPAVQNVAVAADNAADALNQLYEEAMKSQISEQRGLQVELARAMGNEPLAKQLEKSNFMSQYAELDAARQKEIEMMYDLNVATRALIESYKTMHSALRKIAENRIDAAVNATDAAMATLERSVDKQRKVLEEQQAKAEESVGNLQAIFDMLKDGAQSLYETVTAAVEKQAIAGRKIIRDAISSGVLPDQDTLSQALSSARAGVEQDIYKSGADNDYARQVLAGEMLQLSEVAGKQLSDAQLQLQTAKDGLVRLDKVVELAREEIDKLRNIDTSVRSVETAIAELAAALKVEYNVRTDVNKSLIMGKDNATYDLKSGTGTNAGGTYFTGASIMQAAQDTLAWGAATGNSAQAANQIYDVIAGSGYSIAQAEQILGMGPGTLRAEVEKMGLPVFHDGTNYVPREGLALLDGGEMVVPAEHNPWTNPGDGEETRLLREMVIILAQMNDGSNNTSVATQKMARLLEDVTENGAGMKQLTE